MSARNMEVLSAIDVDPSLLILANDAMNARRGEGLVKEPGFAMFTISSALDEVAPPSVVLAVWVRLEALSQLIRAGSAGAWVFADEQDGGKLMNDVVFVAAAKAPLIVEGRTAIRFDADAFNQLALEAAESEGRA